MKQETITAIDLVKNHLKSWRDDVACDGDKEGDAMITTVIDILDSLPELEEQLAYGGLVKDVDGNWLKHGDRIKFIHRIKKDGYGNEKELLYGYLAFSSFELAWYAVDDKQDVWYKLGCEFEEVEAFYKAVVFNMPDK